MNDCNPLINVRGAKVCGNGCIQVSSTEVAPQRWVGVWASLLEVPQW